MEEDFNEKQKQFYKDLVKHEGGSMIMLSIFSLFFIGCIIGTIIEIGFVEYIVITLPLLALMSILTALREAFKDFKENKEKLNRLSN